MNIKHLKQIFFLSLIFSAIILLVVVNKIILDFWILAILFVLFGCIFSFLNHEKQLIPYAKLAILNSFVSAFVFSLIFFVYCLLTDSLFFEHYNCLLGCLRLLIVFIVGFLFIGLVMFYGHLVGIIPKGIVEKLKGML